MLVGVPSLFKTQEIVTMSQTSLHQPLQVILCSLNFMAKNFPISSGGSIYFTISGTVEVRCEVIPLQGTKTKETPLSNKT